MKKVFEKSGIDNNGSFLPKNLHPQHTDSPVGGQDESFAEARLVMGGAVEELLRKTGDYAAWHDSLSLLGCAHSISTVSLPGAAEHISLQDMIVLWWVKSQENIAGLEPPFASHIT